MTAARSQTPILKMPDIRSTAEKNLEFKK